MRDWTDYGVWEERHKELMREAEDRRLVRELRGQPVASRWKRLFGLLGITAVPFVGFVRW